MERRKTLSRRRSAQLTGQSLETDHRSCLGRPPRGDLGRARSAAHLSLDPGSTQDLERSQFGLMRQHLENEFPETLDPTRLADHSPGMLRRLVNSSTGPSSPTHLIDDSETPHALLPGYDLLSEALAPHVAEHPEYMPAQRLAIDTARLRTLLRLVRRVPLCLLVLTSACSESAAPFRRDSGH
jgi:hypothetical protein